jgi:hypothetical protein
MTMQKKKFTELLEYSAEATSDSTTSLVEKFDGLRDAENASLPPRMLILALLIPKKRITYLKKEKKNAQKEPASLRKKTNVAEISNVSLASTSMVPSPTSSHSTSLSNFLLHISHSFLFINMMFTGFQHDVGTPGVI